MRRIDDVGISLEEFVDRIADSGSVVRRWPFSHMANDERYAAEFLPTAVGLDVPDQARAFVIGQVAVEDELPWLNVRDTTNYRLRLNTDGSRQSSAWEQLVGVRVALHLELGSSNSESSRDAQALRILGIEQPLKTPRGISSNHFAGRNAGDKFGYIQGIVQDTRESSHKAEMYLGRGMSGATLLYDNAQLMSARGTAESHLAVGGQIRTRVTRSDYAPTSFRPSEGVVYVLKP